MGAMIQRNPGFGKAIRGDSSGISNQLATFCISLRIDQRESELNTTACHNVVAIVIYFNREATMSEEPKAEGRTITDELSKLGKQMADAIKAAWESDDRKKLQAEITEGLRKFGDEVAEALDKAGQSDTAKELRVKAEQVSADMREKGVVEDVRKGIISGLDVLNKELGKLVEKLEPKATPEGESAAGTPDEPAAPEAPDAPEA
jgi:hypothetical protein